MSAEVVVLHGARTPFGEFNGVLSGFSEIELGSIASRAALERSGVSASAVDHVIFGNALQASRHAVYGARHVGLGAGIPDGVPALTVNRLCGSGIQSVISAAHQILLDESEVVLAGGMESMSQAPHVVRGIRPGLRLGDGALEDSLTVALLDSRCGLQMAQTADVLARESGVTRQEADRFAVRSQKLAREARSRGLFGEEIAPVLVTAKRGETIVEEDEHPRPDTTLEDLSALRTVFGTGTVTAGNASGIVDGAAALIVAASSCAARNGLATLGKLLGWHVVGVEPRVMGIGPVGAILGLLRKAGLSLAEIDLFEINEAFGVQYLAVEKSLGLDRERVNVNGGAIALGHPLGATGTRLVLTVLLELRRRGGRYGIAAACIGGGQGIALLVESTRAQGA